MTEETFLPISGWEGLYEVSNLGRVRSLPRVVRRHDGTIQSFKGGIMTPIKMTVGYVCARLSDTVNGRRERASIHRLVATAFHPNPNNLPQVNHLNAIRDDNRAVNLEWTDARGNILHAWKIGNMSQAKLYTARGEESVKAKLTEQQVYEIKDRLAAGETTRSIAKRYSIGKTSVSRILHGKSWAHLPKRIEATKGPVA